ncbi:SHC-transforming protein 4-like isoform X2 [Denticeps clupeoides]|uniref:SHC-transforming protein 4-like isoform X2 n=1 Tax=Denticeps clupeoides TaxID=299321 RepID=UPI0010A3988C|nr:SHC-transforming protein 4 isoform X2 [Denticeps clupeoides]
MRERKVCGNTGLFVQKGMLYRSKYSRLRNDSVTSLEDSPQSGVSLKVGTKAPEPPKSLAPLDDLSPPAQETSSILCAFIPRMANMKISSPASLLGLRLTARQTPPNPAGPGCCASEHHGISCPLAHNTECLSSRCKVDMEIEWCRLANPECGVSFQIKYMGCLEVVRSMRALDFETRTQVTREAICRLCDSVQRDKLAVKRKRTYNKSLSSILGKSNLQFSGKSIKLNITTNSLELTSLDSFQDTADYVAYVAKDSVNKRACHILECPEGLAQDVINTIGQAFEKRFRQLLRNPLSLMAPKERQEEVCCSHAADKCCAVERAESHNYYNEIPGKPPPRGGLQDMRLRAEELREAEAQERTGSLLRAGQYENCPLSQSQLAPPGDSENAGHKSCEVEVEAGGISMPSTSVPMRKPLAEEAWYHGKLSRQEAESRLADSGDFLVRESCSSPGQYVLSGLQGDTAKHLLLVDPEGMVRTKDHVFHSVGHLIRYHMDNHRPIVSCGSELCLKQPVLQNY